MSLFCRKSSISNYTKKHFKSLAFLTRTSCLVDLCDSLDAWHVQREWYVETVRRMWIHQSIAWPSLNCSEREWISIATTSFSGGCGDSFVFLGSCGEWAVPWTKAGDITTPPQGLWGKTAWNWQGCNRVSLARSSNYNDNTCKQLLVTLVTVIVWRNHKKTIINNTWK